MKHSDDFVSLIKIVLEEPVSNIFTDDNRHNWISSITWF